MNQKGLPARAGIIHLLPLVLVGVLIAAVAGGVFYFNQDKPLISKQETEPSPSPESLMEEEMSNWKTFNNDIFSFRYPVKSTLSFKPTENEVSVKTIDGDFVSIEYYNAKEISIDELVNQHWNYYPEEINNASDLGNVITSVSPNSKISLGPNGVGETANIYLQNDAHVVWILVLGESNEIHQILSTFEFNGN